MISKNIRITGIVQGVGFRPFIYQAAMNLGLKGFVSNTSDGVWICIQGKSKPIETFIETIRQNPPIHAKIHDLSIASMTPGHYHSFQIIESHQSSACTPVIPPDIATCQDCLNEMNDPSDCRFQYPFINCTNCGPRFTIVNNIPYDRHQTSMASFSFCHECQKEYADPTNRRFHAQATACPKCGPHVQLFDHNHQRVKGDPIQKTIEYLKKGKIIAIKGLGGFHLAVDASNDHAICRLRQYKHRPHKPFAIMAKNINAIKSFAFVCKDDIKQLNSPQSPIVILDQKPGHKLSKHIGSERTFGVMLPYTPLHHLLLFSFDALIMTSGNVSGQPIVSDNETVFEHLSFADLFLIHNRPIINKCDDSIVRLINDHVCLIRRARGFVPEAIPLQVSMPKILALGGHLKNTICLAHDKNAYVSQHLGNLSNVDTMQWMKQTIAFWIKLTGIQPEYVACDMHPSYESTRLANQMELPVIPVAHHHAHVAAVMAEHGLTEPVIGIVLDGTGYGLDQTIWGGEVLMCENQHVTRIAHISPVPMPGGESAIQFPWKMALTWLIDSFGTDGLARFNQLNIIHNNMIDQNSLQIVKKLIEKNIHSPLTSSMGRLFDAIAWMLGVTSPVTFEGQAAIALEEMASESDEIYSWEFHQGDTAIMVQPMIRKIVSDVLNGRDHAVISAIFHNTLIEMFCQLSIQLQNKFYLNKIILSGGVFQNKRLLSGLANRLKKSNLKVYVPLKLPCNDGGISLGQAYVAKFKRDEIPKSRTIFLGKNDL
jgi:hydrogenase maturation protein HypF